MSRIVIHVGMHKTATTHVQDLFHQNRRLLKRHGVIFPFIGRTRGQHGLASAWIRMPPPYPIRDPRRVWRQLARTYGPTDLTVFVSSEELSRLHPVRVDMAELRALTQGFDHVLILCTLRNQASFIQSVYQQVSDERQPGDWVAYLDRAIRSHLVDGLALNYRAILDHLRQGFDAAQIRFLSFDAAVAAPGGIEGAILRQIGVTDLDPATLLPWGDGKSNVSPPPLATFAANAVAAPRMAGRGLVRAMTETVHTTLGTQRTTIFSRDELARVAQVFDPLNRDLERAVAGVQPDFRMGAMLDGRDLAFRGRLRDDFWIEACRRLRAASLT